jgi:hypothetical protein
MNELQRYFEIVRRLREGREVGTKDIEFFLSYSPEIDESKMQKLIEGGEFTSAEEANAAIMEAGKQLQSSPTYKAKTLEIAKAAESGRINEKLSQGINLILAGTDIANSINQIRASEAASRKSKKPYRPAVPQRDLYLQNALRGAEEGTMDAARALAPAQAQIQDTYLGDIQDAKTASTGQAGAYGAYRQLAANRRNRAALNLAPIQDDIRSREQARYDNLLGMRMGETQTMFNNQASLYGQDLDQYNREQNAAAQVGAAGRLNLRDSLYNTGNQLSSSIADNYTNRKYRNLYNQAMASGVNPKYAIEADKNLSKYYGSMTSDDTPNYWEQIY